MRVLGMRKGIIVTVNAADRARLEGVAANRNSPQKHAWRCRIGIPPLAAAFSGSGE